MSTKDSKERCIGEYPALWRITYQFIQQVRRSVPYMGETELIGHQLADGQYDVIAMSAAFATATFHANCPVSASDLAATVRDPEFICYVDAITLTQKNRGGHFG